MITVGNVNILMKCVHTVGTGRHKRQADITLFLSIFLVLFTVCGVYNENILSEN